MMKASAKMLSKRVPRKVQPPMAALRENHARWPCFWDGDGLLAGAHIQAKHTDKVRKNAQL
jgi:hypothetical protein